MLAKSAHDVVLVRRLSMHERHAKLLELAKAKIVVCFFRGGGIALLRFFPQRIDDKDLLILLPNTLAGRLIDLRVIVLEEQHRLDRLAAGWELTDGTHVHIAIE